jgi:hypothetical protein
MNTMNTQPAESPAPGALRQHEPPVRRLLFEAYDALAPALGETRPDFRARHLADLVRLVAAAQAANDALLHPEPAPRKRATRRAARHRTSGARAAVDAPVDSRP